ncbi:MAG: ComEC/Rec2 family competence protein [Lachnospiraceae bacterium]|nr:ComEC/Rec2 family competence protein [Lachnospiraceae bacterium]
MNKRPLFWAVMCFAFGEVMYIFADEGRQIGTAVAVLICVVLIFLRFKISAKYKLVYIAFIIFGILRIWWEDLCRVDEMLFGERVSEVWKTSYEGYDVYCSRNGPGGSCDINGFGIVEQIAIGGSGCNVTISLENVNTDKGEIKEDVRIIVYGLSGELSIGDEVKVKGRLNPFVLSGNPGEFDKVSYYRARSIVGYGYGSSMEVNKGDKDNSSLSPVEKIWYGGRACLYKARMYFMDKLEQIANPEIAATYSGILLGEKSGIPEEDMLLYRLCGIAHIFAISGLHISIVGGLLYKGLRRMGLGFLGSATFAMAIALLYGVMTGFSFSTIRAVVMLALSLGGEVLGRRYDMITAMGMALLLLLVVQPYRLVDGGLILSFGAVAGVVISKYIIKLLEENTAFGKLKKKKTRKIYNFVSSVVFSTGISLVTTPLIAYMYYQIPLYSMLINMIIVPLMSVTVFCGFAGVIISIVSIGLGGMIIWPGALSLELYQHLCGLVMKLPGAVINTGKPDELHILMYYFALLVVLMLINPRNISLLRRSIKKRTGKWIAYGKLKLMVKLVVVMTVAICGMTIGIMKYLGRGDNIIFLDVGQGDGILIKTTNGVNMVVDVGSSSNESLGEYVVIPGLLAEGMGHIDYWFISHLDADHISGLMYILRSEVDIGVDIDNIVLGECGDLEAAYGELLKLAEERGINIIHMRAGACITDGDFVVTAVHPAAGFNVEDKNEMSLVLEYRVGSFSALFTGDIGMEAIEYILEYESLNLNEYDIIKQPHHGSKYSASAKLLDRVNPTVAIISCGAYNMYGHPHDETIELLEESQVDIYRTDRLGAIRIYIEKNGIK